MNMYLVGVYSAQWSVRLEWLLRVLAVHISALGSALASPVDLGFVGIRMSEPGTGQLASLNEAQTVPEAIEETAGPWGGDLGDCGPCECLVRLSMAAAFRTSEGR